jgi:Fic family protein
MPLKNLLQQIDIKKQKLDSLRPLNTAKLKNLQKIFNIDLTYNSNAIEGSTLSYAETKLILNEGLTIGGKKLSEHLEVINHKEALDFIETLSHMKPKDLKLKDILDIHFLILKGISTKDAGIFRVKNVGVKKSDGEIYHFTAPIKIEDAMREFVAWLLKKSDLHPVVFAGEVHYRFVTIHPFIDGNGRTARLLMNLILLQYGYPQAVIKVTNRAEYITAIENAQDTNDLEQFYIVIARATLDSLGSYLDILEQDIELI